jgi:hypothetical protein
LGAANCSLVSDQDLLAKDEDRNPVDCRGNFRGKGFVSVYATDAGQQIDSTRRSSQLNHLLRLQEISFLEAGLLEPELDSEAREVAGRCPEWPDENVQVAGVTWAPMKRQALRADDDVINAAGI